MIVECDIEQFEPSGDKVIWDVRDVTAYQQGHIKHAISKPLETISLADVQAVSDTIYVLCGGGTKAVRAAHAIDDLVPNCQVVHLVGGTHKAAALGWQLISEKE